MIEVQFFFGPGSRYSYLAATQLGRIEAEFGARFRWRALFSGELIARAGGGPRSPQDPAYRALDVSRWARRYGVPYREPQGAPDWRKLAMACVAAERLGAGPAFALALYAETFGAGAPPLDDAALGRVATQAGLEAAGLLSALGEESTTKAYERNLTDALAAGAFGAPTFVTPDGALFWGQDRLPILTDHIRALGAG